MSIPTPGERQLLGVAPLFLVADVTKAAAHYRDVFGFHFEQIWGEPPCFAMPARDGLIVMLSQTNDRARIAPHGSDGRTWDAYFWVRDADQLFAEFVSKGARVAYPPCDQEFYGNREFAVFDADGYCLAFAHDLTARRR